MNLRTQIFLAAFALGLLPLITLVGINLSGHIKRHEEVGLKQAEALQSESFSKINSRIDHYRQTLEAISKLPEIGKIVAGSSSQPSKELLDLLNSWLSARDAILEVSFFDINENLRLSLIRDDLYFEVSNDTTIIPNSNQVMNVNEIIMSTASISRKYKLSASFRIDTDNFLAEHLDSFWISPTGNYLRQPLAIQLTLDPDTNAFEDFPDLQTLLSFRRASLWESKSGFTVTWIPILLDGLRPALWVGSLVDRTAAIKWKKSLIRNIITIVLVMSVIIFFIANGIAKKIDSIKERILTGLDQVLNNNQEFKFTWTGPKEITTMAEDLSRLAQQYIRTSKARYAAESALRENQENFNNLTNSAQDAIVLMDHHGDISYWNETAEEMFGYSRHEAMGKPIHSLISPRMVEDSKPKPRKERPLGEGPIRETIELISKKKSGSDLPVELSLSEARIKDKWHSIWIIRDISERKWAEEKSNLQQQQLIQADKMVSLGLLVSGVAHEINNPNSISLLNTPMLAKSWNSISPILEKYYSENGDFLVAGLDYSEMREQVPRLFEELEESSRRIKSIVKDLKDYARQDTSMLMEQVDINKIAKASARLTGNLIKNSTANFIESYSENLPPIKGNSQRLEQIIINLLQNSCDALENNQASITLKTEFDEKDNRIDVIVTDEGCGIPPESINKVTDPFFTTKRDKGGTGLGLSVSAGIIKEHGGTISFSSKGNGTSVTMSFPVPETPGGESR